MEEKERKELAGTMIVPSIDMSKIQEYANQYAMEGMRKALEVFYTGYDSPFKKAVLEHFEDQVPSFDLDLPRIMAMLNEALSSMCDQIVNQAIATSYIPLVNDLLTQTAKEVRVSDIVKKFVEHYQDDRSWDSDNFTAYLQKDDKFDWYNLYLESAEDEVKLHITLHNTITLNENGNRYYKLLSMPYEERYGDKFGRMKCTVTTEDGKNATLEMPYGHGVLCDGFLRYIARLVMFQTCIVLDTMDFEDIVYPDNEFND